jgi:carboxyl-terminal processing protease
MFQRISSRAVLVLFSLLVLSPNSHAATLACKYIDAIERSFLHQHVTFNSLNENLESRTIEQYIKRLDPAKIYLQKGDLVTIRSKMKGIFQQIQNNKCGVLDDVQNLYVKRVEERAQYAKKTLEDKKFKFDQKTEITLDPDTRDFPKTKAEADKYQLKYLNFQVSNYLASGTKQEEAVPQVIRNYDRMVKRAKDTTQEDIFSNYLDSFGRALDPHSSFLSRDSLEDFNIQMGLSLEGIGATLSSQDGFTVVEQLIPGGSASSSGLIEPGDKIVGVGQFKPSGEPADMENVIEMDLRDVVRRIRGPKGSKVRLTVLKKTGGSKTTIELTRDQIKLEEEAAQLSFIDKEIGGEKKKIAIMNLPSFYADSRRGGRSSASDMKALMKKAKEANADAMVLDLSQNGGGSLDDAVKISGLFFKTGNVVKQSSRDATSAEVPLDDRDAEVDWEKPLVVLTSRVSASASEIVAGTLKDYQRAVIVGGDHTFGKGSVQSVAPLPPGMGALKVTVGMFFTPGGFSTQHRGVEGDIVLPSPYATDEIGEKSLDYSLPPKKIKAFLSPDAYVTTGDAAWKKVSKEEVDFLKGKSVARVDKNEEFQKIKAELKKSKERGKVLKLAEALKDTKEKKDEQEKKKELTKEEKLAEYLKRADIQEAANVAADLLEVRKKPGLTQAGKMPPAAGT